MQKRFLGQRHRILSNGWRHGIVGVDDADSGSLGSAHTKRSKLSHATRDRRAEKRRLYLQKFDIYLEDVDEQTYDSRDSREHGGGRRSSDLNGSPRAQSERAETAYMARMRREAGLEP